MRVNAPDATFKNGRYELRRHARGVLVLADPPEAGWRIKPPSEESAAAREEAEAGGDRERDRRARPEART